MVLTLQRVKTELKPGEVLIRFNVNWPLDAQLESARRTLQRYAQLAGRKPRRNSRAGKCFRFICACWMPRRRDLAHCGGKVIVSRATDVYPEYCGSKHVRNALNAAKRWQRDYLFVACAR